MTPSERQMPIVEVGGRPGRWLVHLPGGDRTMPTIRGVKALVDAEACGSAIRFPIPAPTGTGGSAGIGLLASRGVRPGRRRSEDGT